MPHMTLRSEDATHHATVFWCYTWRYALMMPHMTQRSDDATHDATLWRCYTSRYGVLMLHMTLRSDDATLDATLVWCYTPVLSRNVSDPTEHRNVLALHYLNKNPGLNPVLLALARFRKYAERSCTPVSQVFKAHRGNVKKTCRQKMITKKCKWNTTTKNPD